MIFLWSDILICRARAILKCMVCLSQSLPQPYSWYVGIYYLFLHPYLTYIIPTYLQIALFSCLKVQDCT